MGFCIKMSPLEKISRVPFKLNHLFSLPTILLLLISPNAVNASDRNMVCRSGWDHEKLYFKHEKGFFGDKYFIRSGVEWLNVSQIACTDFVASEGAFKLIWQEDCEVDGAVVQVRG